MSSAGLEIRVVRGKNGFADVAIKNRRLFVAPLTIGRQAACIPEFLSSILTVCREAHKHAAQTAIAAASGQIISLTAEENHRLSVEITGEHLRHTLIDWSDFLGLGTEKALFAEFFRTIAIQTPNADSLNRLYRKQDAIRLALRLMDDRISTLAKGPDHSFLSRFSKSRFYGSEDFFPDEAFCRYPVNDGTPSETGPIVRHKHRAKVETLIKEKRFLEARFEAVCADVDDFVCQKLEPKVEAVPCADRVGFSQVETARGILSHYVRLDEASRVLNYAIVAPTEWNFHPCRPLHYQVSRTPFNKPDNVERYIKALVLALDPCVEYTVLMEVNDA